MRCSARGARVLPVALAVAATTVVAAAHATEPPAGLPRAANAQQADRPAGERLIDRLRAELDGGDWTAALQTRRDILALDPPPGIVLLVDAWLNAFARDPANRERLLLAGYLPGSGGGAGGTGPQGLIRLSAGYDTNPYAGPSASQVRVSGALGEQTLALAPASLPRATTVLGVRADLGHALETTFAGENLLWLYGGQASQLGQPPAGAGGLDGLAYTGLAGRSTDTLCPDGRRCGFSAVYGGGQLRDVSYDFVNVRLTASHADSRWAVTGGTLRRQGTAESVRAGVEWSGALGTAATGSPASRPWLEAGLTRDFAQNNRAGGDQWRMRLGLRWLPAARVNVDAQCEHVQDDTPFAPALFGELVRRQQLCELSIGSVVKKATDWNIKVLANLRSTRSNSALFTSNGGRLELVFERVLGR